MKIVHVLNRYGQNGISAGLINLARNGFYSDPLDVRIIAISKGEGETQATLSRLLGPKRVTYLSESSKPSLSQDFLSITSSLRKQIHDFGPEIAICSNTISIFLMRTAAMFNPKIRIASFMHDSVCEDTFIKNALRLTSFRDSMVLGDSAVTLKEVTPLLFLSHPPSYVVPLVIPEVDAARPVETVSHFSLLSLGRLHAQKNYAELIHAAAMLAKKNYSFELKIAGEGAQRQALETLVRDLGLEDRISLPGYQDKRSLLKSAHIYVQPSLHEGLGLAFVEAMGAGAVVVGTDVGGMKEYGRDDINMYKIHGFDRDAIAGALQRAMDNFAVHGAAISRNAVEMVQENFGEQVVKSQWATVRSAFARMAPGQPQP